MNKNPVLMLMLLLCCELEAMNLSSTQEQQVRDVVGAYCHLLSDFSKSREYYSNQDKIVDLFPPQVGDVSRFVIDDLKSMQMTDIRNYLSMLTAQNQYYYSVKLSYLEDINKVSINGLFAPNREKSDAVKYGVMTLTKQVNGAINKTIKNVFWVNLTSNKIDRILTETQEDLLTQGLKYYNSKSKQHEEAFICFRKAAEMGDDEARYYLAVMLLKGLGCKHIPKNVRDAEASSWLRKLYIGYGCEKILNLFLYSSNKSRCEDINRIFHSLGIEEIFIEDLLTADIPYNEGLIQIWKGNKVGFADKTGKIIIPCIYKRALVFSEGLVAVQDKNKLWGFIDKNNKTVIDFKYSGCLPFRENLAGVMLNGKWGYISSSNKIEIPFKYDEAGDFKESCPADENIKLAVVKLNDKYYKIGSDGNVYYELETYGIWKKLIN